MVFNILLNDRQLFFLENNLTTVPNRVTIRIFGLEKLSDRGLLIETVEYLMMKGFENFRPKSSLCTLKKSFDMGKKSAQD